MERTNGEHTMMTMLPGPMSSVGEPGLSTTVNSFSHLIGSIPRG